MPKVAEKGECWSLSADKAQVHGEGCKWGGASLNDRHEIPGTCQEAENLHVGGGGYSKEGNQKIFCKKVKGADQGAKTPKIKIQPNDMLGC